MKKSLFDDNEKYTQDANKISQEMLMAIKPIFKKYKKEFSVRELALLFYNVVGEAEYTTMLFGD